MSGCGNTELPCPTPPPCSFADDGFNVGCCNTPIPNVPTEKNLAGVSFAVANTTGFLARLLEERPNVRTVSDVQAVVRDSAVAG